MTVAAYESGLVAEPSPLYAHIEFCANAETLWRKIESHWDWLGVKADGTLVVGYPKLGGRMIVGGVVQAFEANATEGEYVVEATAPNSAGWSGHHFDTAEAAREEYRSRLEDTDPSDRPTLRRVRLKIGGEIVDEEYLVRTFKTYR